MVLDKVPGRGKRRGGRTSRSAMKKNLTKLQTRNKHDHMDCSSEHSEERSNITTIDPHQFNTSTDELHHNLLPVTIEDWGPMGPLSPISQLVDSVAWDPDELFGVIEEEIVGGGVQRALDDGGAGTHQTETEAEARSSPAQVEKKLLGGVQRALDDGAAGTQQTEAEARPSPAQVEKKLLYWDLEGIEAELWDEQAEMSSWQWDNDDNNMSFQIN